MELPTTLQLLARYQSGKPFRPPVIAFPGWNGRSARTNEFSGHAARTPVMDLQDWNQIAFQTITGAEAAETSDFLTAQARYQNASILMKQLARKATGPIHGLDGSVLNKLSNVLLIEASILGSNTDNERKLRLHVEARHQTRALRKMLKMNKYYLQWRQWAKTNEKEHKRKAKNLILQICDLVPVHTKRGEVSALVGAAKCSEKLAQLLVIKESNYYTSGIKETDIIVPSRHNEHPAAPW